MRTYYLAAYYDKVAKRWKLVTREFKDSDTQAAALLANYKAAKYKTKILAVELPV